MFSASSSAVSCCLLLPSRPARSGSLPAAGPSRASALRQTSGLGCSSRATAAPPPRGRLSLRVEATNGNSNTKPLSYKNLMVTIFDANPYLSEGSRQALVTASQLAGLHDSKVTVVVVDDEGKSGLEETTQKLSNIQDYMAQVGCSDFNVIEKITSENHSALVGNVAEEMNADMVVIHSDSVHEHAVDANLLAEFVPCSTLLLP